MNLRSTIQLLVAFLIVDDDAIYLDPHVTQNFIDLDTEEFDDSSYHPESYSRINFDSLDPSLAMVFLRPIFIYFGLLRPMHFFYSVFFAKLELSGKICSIGSNG